jgi:fused signal recognition particle receptor
VSIWGFFKKKEKGPKAEEASVLPAEPTLAPPMTPAIETPPDNEVHADGASAESSTGPAAADHAPALRIHEPSLVPETPRPTRRDETFAETPSSAHPASGGQPSLESEERKPEETVFFTQVATPTPSPAVAEPQRKEGDFFGRLWSGLSKSSSKLTEGMAQVFVGKPLDQAQLDELEELLILSDMGAPAAAKITTAIAKDRFDKNVTEAEIKNALAAEIAKILKPRQVHLDLTAGPRPHVVLVVGVNGSGKTTTIGKLCWLLSQHGAKVVVGAADTFRAAAIEQLKVWAERSGAAIVARGQGADAAGVAFDAVKLAKEQGADVVLIDTAGRLQNRTELMAELDKIMRAIRKVDEDAPHDTLIVLDATVGQNALHQMEAFRTTANISGLVMTKLDGTAKGGVLVAIAERHALPVHFVGVGESAEDLQPFDADAFAKALVGV